MSALKITPVGVDRALTAQLVVAWAGERDEGRARLGWWATDLVSEFGGEDLFKRLLPATWAWATLQGAREAARRHDAAARGADHAPDQLWSLFHLGPEADERIDERLRELKSGGRSPADALPGLQPWIGHDFDQASFEAWLGGRRAARATDTPTGRLLDGLELSGLEPLVDALLAGLLPLPKQYPLPHVRSAR